MIYILVINETEGPIIKALEKFDNFSLRKLEDKIE